MAYYSLFHMDPHEVRKLGIMNRCDVHGAIRRLFPDVMSPSVRHLFKIKNDSRDGMDVLVQSGDEPTQNSHIKKTREIPDNLFNFTRYQFHVECNPTNSIKGVKRGTRVNIFNYETALAWFEKKAAASGFKVVGNSMGVPKFDREYGVKRDMNSIIWSVMQVNGILEVTDKDLFKHTVLNGFGCGKAYGFGLIEIKVVQ